uniref:ARAD1B01122p n=1 Tax=Blastobotrys adeninivorans TaxID=409370 RepID=A0A060T4P2_BLAAD
MSEGKRPINLFRGHPTESLLARTEVLEGCQKLLAPQSRPGDNDDEIRHPLTYGSDPGAENVRKLIAQWSNKAHGETAYNVPHHDCINLTNGASFGAQMVLQQATCPHTGYTRRAFVVSPTYFLINKVFEDAGFKGKMTAIPEKFESGVDVDLLEKKLQYYDSLPDESGGLQKVYDTIGGDESSRKVYKYVMYCVPTFSNPRGSTMPLEVRRRLIQLARKHDMVILCDDVYDLLKYDPLEATPPRLVTIDRTWEDTNKHGNVVSNCTFSKLLGPGLRVGWHETATPELATQLSQAGATKSGGTPAHMNTMVVGEIIKDGTINKVIANLCKVFGERAEQVKEELQARIPQAKVQGGHGGYFIWVTIPNVKAIEVAKKAKQHGLILAPEDDFLVADDEQTVGERNGFRVSVSYEPVDRAVQGIDTWASLLK